MYKRRVFIQASFETCAQRDPKGLYAKVAAGEIKQFTGKDSGFEEPSNPELQIDTETNSSVQAVAQLLKLLRGAGQNS